MDNQFIIDNSCYVIAKDKNNNDVTNREVHDVVFKIMCEIDRVCRKNKVDYALAFGSALGLYNFGGFIPWDDDGDIIIDYFDIPKLIDALKKDLGEDYVFECYETDNRYNVLIPLMKVRYKYSYIKEKNHITLPNRCKNGDGIFVDICAFMGVPEDKKKHKKLFWKSKLMMPLMVLLDSFLHINPKCMKKSLKKYEEKIANQYKDSNYVSQTVIIPFQELPKKFVNELAFPKEVIYPFKEYLFNGYPLYSVNNLEEFCRIRYGERALKKIVNGQVISPFKEQNKKSDHLLRVDIYKK